ncbi:MAG: ABC transporter permease subunit [Vallitalea sp.]|jgi:putative aldouronate transport system permease protein|nr:ABC transporter permease subunit [Vallitalea sp.]
MVAAIKRNLKLYNKHRMLFFMLLPTLIYFIIFKYGPMYGILIAFKDFYPQKGILGSEWVGLKYFKELFSSIYFLPVLKNTLIISFAKLIIGFPAPIILCLLLNEVKNAKFKKVVQTVSYLPYFISWVVVAGIFIELLSPSRGPINYIIQAMGMKPVFFVASPKWFRSILVSSDIWKGVGWSSIIYLAAITNINTELYEAAEIDGAGRLRKIWNITLPCIAPIITIMLIFASGHLINDNFEQVYNFLNPNVMKVGDVISTYTYREGLERLNYSYASAVGAFKNVVSFSMVMLVNYISRKVNETSLW